MADVRPFKGLLFDPDVVGPMEHVICPPYDVIDFQTQEQLYKRNRYNVVRLEEGKIELSDDDVENRYTRSAEHLRLWIEEAALVRDEIPSYYLVRHGFKVGNGFKHRLGLVAAVRLERYEKGSVIPHEYTRSGPKADRLALMEKCHANISHIMLLYRDSQNTILQMLASATTETLVFNFKDSDNQTFEVWRIMDPPQIKFISDMLADKPLYIADGHHRYETSLTYRDGYTPSSNSDDHARNFVLSYLVEFNDPGLIVSPYHRVIRNSDIESHQRLNQIIHQCFIETPLQWKIGSPTEGLLLEIEGKRTYPGSFCMVSSVNDTASILTLKEEYMPDTQGSIAQFEAWILEEMILKPAFEDGIDQYVEWMHNPSEALDRLAGNSHQMAFLLSPPSMSLLEEIINSGKKLPRKSTFFYPKLPTGLVINLLESIV